MKYLLGHVRKTMKDRVIISFFFNARGEELEKTTLGMYRSLLFQLLERVPELQNVFDQLESTTLSHGATPAWNLENLKELFGCAVRNLSKHQRLACIIDALDECDEGHSQDISNYLQSELRIGRSQQAEQIRAEILKKASGIFMWVVLVVQILNREYDNGRIHALKRRLQDIPTDLHELFRDILTRDCQNQDELLLSIQWILFAKRPLKPEELYFAIISGIEPRDPNVFDLSQVTQEDMGRFILSSSKGLAETTISKSRTVQFIHESVRETFFSKKMT
ncbi:hypothetical protein VTN77DRAFT_7296 [Rasamsonia byssochlamydoides]|uniref:uncharacterized protein n=1 Tax=Rasamsonia byssochlamydoides TaxID=89139 RepID=UPI0037421EEB